VRPRVFALSPRGTDTMDRSYAEMGQPGAAALVDGAAFDTLYLTSRGARGLGIARPPGTVILS